MKTLKWCFLFFFVFLLGVLSLRLAIKSNYTYKEPLQTWLNKAKALKNDSRLFFSDRTISNKKLKLIYSDEIFEKIKELRDSTFKKGVLTDAEKVKFKGQLIVDNDTVHVKFRLKGNLNDHRRGKRWSYRIYSNHTKVLGMNTFSVMAPQTRYGLGEWYFHKLMKQEGLIALEYNFIEFNDNDRVSNIYALEQSFDTTLLKKNNKKPGIIFKLNEDHLINSDVLDNQNNFYSISDLFLMAPVKPFNKKMIKNSEQLRSDLAKAKKLFNKFRREEVPLHEAFDVDQAAKLFALIDLTGAYHGIMWKNVRFYYNPDKDLLELFSHDGCTGRPSEILFDMWKRERLFDVFSDVWLGLFFKNRDFLNSYYSYLTKFSNPNFLKTFNAEYTQEIEQLKSYLVEDVSYKNFSENYFERNALYIHSYLEKLSWRKENLEQLVRVEKVPIANSDSYEVLVENYSYDTLSLLYNNHIKTILPRTPNRPANIVRTDTFTTKSINSKFEIYSKSDTLTINFD